MKKVITILCFILIFSGCYNRDKKADKQSLLSRDYRLFQDTPAWDLAKAVEDEDTVRIKKEITENRVNPDFQESRFGGSLLMLAIFNGQYTSAKTLLSLGADPNLKDTSRGSSAMIDAAEQDDPNYLRLLLSYKGDPNSRETAPVSETDRVRKAPLNAAIPCMNCSSLEKVELLVEAGADINYSNNGNPAYTRLPLANAVMLGKMDIALYLLQKGADYKRVLYTTADNQEVYILEALRTNVFDLDSKEYRQKLQVINFLRSRGLNYSQEPVPAYILRDIKMKYPNSWEEYVKKY